VLADLPITHSHDPDGNRLRSQYKLRAADLPGLKDRRLRSMPLSISSYTYHLDILGIVYGDTSYEGVYVRSYLEQRTYYDYEDIATARECLKSRLQK
jgi:hypothetical protein